MKGLTRRLITGVVFVLVMIAGIYGGHITFFILFALITATCLWEYLTLVLDRNRKRDKLRRILGLCMGMIPFVLTASLQFDLVQNRDPFIALWSLLLFPFIFLSFVYELYSNSDRPFVNVAYIVLGMVYIGVPFSLLAFIAFDGEQYHANIIFGLLALNWANDSGAYLIGSRLGKTALFPRVSPNKTWEGMTGGILNTLLIAWGLSALFDDLRLVDWLMLAAIVIVFGSLGDLVESMFKRSMAVKDSGSLLPGHGGVLDRFDAFIFLLPFATAYLLWIR